MNGDLARIVLASLLCGCALGMRPTVTAAQQVVGTGLTVSVVSGASGLPGALVILVPANSGSSDRLRHTFTDTKGLARFGPLAPGTYYAVGYLAGFDPARTEFIVGATQLAPVVLPLQLCMGHPCPHPTQNAEPAVAPAPSPVVRQ